jgi:hypothetical protein
MQKLLVQRNELDYVGLFSEPALSLWGDGKKILQGMFTAFRQHQVSLADLRNDSSSLHPSDQVVTVKFGTIGEYRFKFDRVELTLVNFTRNSLLEVPKLLTAGDGWLRSVIPGFTFKTHLFACLSHSELDHGTSQEFLRDLSSLDIPGVGISEGCGIIYHWDVKEKGWRVQFTIDHSLSVDNGLFLNYLIRPSGDRIDYVSFIAEGTELFDRMLSKIGLEAEDRATEHQ